MNTKQKTKTDYFLLIINTIYIAGGLTLFTWVACNIINQF